MYWTGAQFLGLRSEGRVVSQMVSTKREPFRLALVGCGHISKKHLAALSRLDQDFEVVGVVDPDRQARALASELAKGRAFESLEQCLEAEAPDLAVLASPTGLHPEQAVVAAQAGAHILTEKPLGTSLQAARSMVEEVSALERRLFIVKQLRYHPLFLALRRALLRGRFGRLYTIGLQVFWTRPQAYYDLASWRGTWEMDGGALMNQASHYVDLLDWLFGPVQSVYAVGGALGRQIEAEDTAVVTLQWEEGFVGSLHVTMLAYPKNLATSLTVIGDRGTVRLGGPLCDQVEAWDFLDDDPQDEAIQDIAAAVPDILRRGHERVYQNVASSLRQEEALAVGGEEGLRSLAIIDAAYRALRSGAVEAVDNKLGLRLERAS